MIIPNDLKQKWQQAAIEQGVLSSCVNCSFFSNGKCNAYREQTPPPEVIAIGCPTWEYYVPF